MPCPPHRGAGTSAAVNCFPAPVPVDFSIFPKVLFVLPGGLEPEAVPFPKLIALLRAPEERGEPPGRRDPGC